jgi:hypothetical protein
VSVELDRGVIRAAIEHALRYQIRSVNLVKRDVAKELSEVVCEALFETAVVTKASGPEAGITAGKTMIQKWID